MYKIFKKKKHLVKVGMLNEECQVFRNGGVACSSAREGFHAAEKWYELFDKIK